MYTVTNWDFTKKLKTNDPIQVIRFMDIHKIGRVEYDCEFEVIQLMVCLETRDAFDSLEEMIESGVFSTIMQVAIGDLIHEEEDILQ